jgi:hypothetical protein
MECWVNQENSITPVLQYSNTPNPYQQNDPTSHEKFKHVGLRDSDAVVRALLPSRLNRLYPFSQFTSGEFPCAQPKGQRDGYGDGTE